MSSVIYLTCMMCPYLMLTRGCCFVCVCRRAGVHISRDLRADHRRHLDLFVLSEDIRGVAALLGRLRGRQQERRSVADICRVLPGAGGQGGRAGRCARGLRRRSVHHHPIRQSDAGLRDARIINVFPVACIEVVSSFCWQCRRIDRRASKRRALCFRTTSTNIETSVRKFWQRV